MAEVGGGIEIMYQCCFYRCVCQLQSVQTVSFRVQHKGVAVGYRHCHCV